jgi:SRSO17 transposase
MDTQQIRNLQPKLDRFLESFDDCFLYDGTRAHLRTYVEGQLSDLPRKSVEPIALKAGVPPRTLQEFLSLLSWDHGTMRDVVERRVAKHHASSHSIGVVDDTGCPKKGTHSPGVQRQWCGATGKTDNCQVSVHLSYVADDFYTMLDGELYLPESWSEDRERCQACGIPDDLAFRPKWQIALEIYDRASANGVRFRYLTFDEAYGGNSLFRAGLAARHQHYIGEIPRSLVGWISEPPATTIRRYRRGRRGGPRAGRERLVAGQRRAKTVESHLTSTPELTEQPWTPHYVKDGEKGPMVWEVKHVAYYPRSERDLPGERLHLIIARNALCRDEVKFFLSDAPASTSVEELLVVAFSRWTVERCFEDEKMELGFDHFEGRKYIGLKRHQAICAVTNLFLAELRLAMREKKSADHALPDQAGTRSARPLVVAVSTVGKGSDRPSRTPDSALSGAQCSSCEESRQAYKIETPTGRH